jgi:hypothetical protein
MDNKDTADIKGYVLGIMPNYRIEKFEERLKKEPELLLEFEALKPIILSIEFEKKRKIQSEKFKLWQQEEEYLVPKPDDIKHIWYKHPVFKYAASVLLFISISYIYWYIGIPQRVADDFIEQTSKEEISGCETIIYNAKEEYLKNKDSQKAISLLKDDSDKTEKCQLNIQLYVAIFEIKAKNYDRAELILKTIIAKSKKNDELKTLNIEANELLEAL